VDAEGNFRDADYFLENCKLLEEHTFKEPTAALDNKFKKLRQAAYKFKHKRAQHIEHQV
jgi:ribosome-associated translation inhibitor RaiA